MGPLTLWKKHLRMTFPKLYRWPNINLQTPALRTIINIASGPNTHITTLLTAHPLATLISFLDAHNSPGLRRDALLTVANIAAGDEMHVAAVLAFPGLIDRVETLVAVVGEAEGEELDDDDLLVDA